MRDVSTKWLSFCKKHKWADWFDDNVVWYCYDKPRGIYKSIRHWFYCNWNIEHYRLVKQAFFSYGWDGSFMTQLEECQIDKAIKWFSEHQLMVDEQYNEIMWSLRIAKYLIHAINNDNELFTFEGEPEYGEPQQVGDSNLTTSEIKLDNMHKIYLGPYVNWRNAHRFCSKHSLGNEYFRNNCSEELYIMKCKHLYAKIREKYTDYWWD